MRRRDASTARSGRPDGDSLYTASRVRIRALAPCRLLRRTAQGPEPRRHVLPRLGDHAARPSRCRRLLCVGEIAHDLIDDLDVPGACPASPSPGTLLAGRSIRALSRGWQRSGRVGTRGTASAAVHASPVGPDRGPTDVAQEVIVVSDHGIVRNTDAHDEVGQHQFHAQWHDREGALPSARTVSLSPGRRLTNDRRRSEIWTRLSSRC